MSTNPTKRIEEIDRRLEELPKGTLTYKKINGKEQPYIQRTIDGKSVSYYVKVSEREKVLVEFEERTKLQEEKRHLTAYAEGLKDILKHNPYLSAQVVIGYQDFEDFTSVTVVLPMHVLVQKVMSIRRILSPSGSGKERRLH